MGTLTLNTNLVPNYDGTIDPRYPAGGKPEFDLSLYSVSSPPTQRHSMVAVTPRPDSETGALSIDGFNVAATYRWAYFDGVNPVRYEFPIKIFGGSAPHIFEILQAPSGATVGNDRTPENHGVVKWVPSAGYTTSAPASFSIRVWGQDLNYIDVSWTVATTDSLDKFVFVSNDSGNDSTGTGSITAPFQTIRKVMGDTDAEITYPNRIVYLRGSLTDYTTHSHSDCWDKNAGAEETVPARLHLDASRKPIAYISFPDESVSINFSGGEILFATGTDDLRFSGSSGGRLTIKGSSTNAAECHNFWFSAAHRGLLAWIDFDGFIPRVRASGGYTNSAPMFSVSVTAPEDRQHWGLHDCNEINRTASSNNDGLIHVFFTTNYWVEEFCGGSRVGTGTSFKDRNFNTSVRYGFYDAGLTPNLAFAFMDQGGGGNNEIVYSAVRGILWYNFQAFAGGVGDHFASRCTVYSASTSYSEAIKAWGDASGPYDIENCVLVASSTTIYSSNITSVGNEVHAVRTDTDFPIDPITLNLVNDTTNWRTLYLGERGWEIE